MTRECVQKPSKNVSNRLATFSRLVAFKKLRHITSQKSGENEPEPGITNTLHAALHIPRASMSAAAAAAAAAAHPVEPQPPVCGDFAKHDLWNVMQESQLGQADKRGEPIAPKS